MCNGIYINFYLNKNVGTQKNLEGIVKDKKPSWNQSLSMSKSNLRMTIIKKCSICLTIKCCFIKSSNFVLFFSNFRCSSLSVCGKNTLTPKWPSWTAKKGKKLFQVKPGQINRFSIFHVVGAPDFDQVDVDTADDDGRQWAWHQKPPVHSKDEKPFKRILKFCFSNLRN